MKEKLNIVDENGKVIGEETREKIHKKGLLHREIHVWFYTPNKEIIFQHRAKDKDYYPDKLDATVGGHVEIGDDFLDTAVKETKEETGVSLAKKDFKFIRKVQRVGYDNVTGLTNNAIRNIYAYCYKGNISNLKTEKGKAIGFEAWSLTKILSMSEAEKMKFSGKLMYSLDVKEMFIKIVG